MEGGDDKSYIYIDINNYLKISDFLKFITFKADFLEMNITSPSHFSTNY